jgi:hypothetical protein
MFYAPVFLVRGKGGFMTQIKNRRMIAGPVMLLRRRLWLLLLLLLLLLPFSVTPATANTVSMVCNGLFDVERIRGEITETEQFDDSVYVTVDLDGDDVSRVQMVPIERNRCMASLDFIKNMPQPANGDLIDFTTSEDDLWISKVSQSGPMVFAVNGEDPYVETPTNAHEMNIRLNRVSGRVQVEWHWHDVRDYLPLDAIRSIKNAIAIINYSLRIVM